MPWLGQTPGPALTITEAKVLPASLNPDGDYVTFAATISSSATWTISIVDGNNSAVKTFSGTGTNVSQKWYGEDAQSVKVADGVYYYRIDAYDASSGSSASWPQGLIMVSRLIPIAIIDAPTDNQQFVGGTIINITGTASDSTNFSSYALAYGSGENPTSWTSLKTATTPITNGLIHAWNTSSRNNAVYTLRLTVTDSAGNVATETSCVRLSWIQNVTASEGYLSPNGDGVKDSTLITASFTEQANWTLTFKNPIGVAIRTYSGTGSALAQTWDGKDEAGQTVPDGTYTYRIDAMGGVVTKTIVVDTTPPTTLITAPTSSAVVRNTVPILGTASDTNLDAYRVEYGPGTGAGPWTLISSATTSVTNGTLANWVTNDQTNSAALQNGGYVVRLGATDKAGNSSNLTIPVTTDNLFLSNVGISDNMIDTAASETSTIFFTISVPAAVTLKVVPERQGPAGTPVYTSSQNMSAAGASSFTWDGKDNTGTVVPDEAYLVVLEASDGIMTDAYSPPAATGTGSVSCAHDSYDPYKNDPMTISYTPSRPSRINISISWANYNFKVVDNAARIAGSHTHAWDGRNVAGKALPESAAVSCSVASLLRENHIVTTNDAISITDLKTDPYDLQLAYGQFTRIKYTVNREALVTVSITSPQGTSVTVMNSQLMSAGAHEVEWTGVDPSEGTGKQFLVSEEGDYFVVVRAVNPLTGTVSTYRGGLKIRY